MIKSSEAYKDAVTGDARRTLLKIILQIISPDIKYKSITSSPQAVCSREDQAINHEFEAARYNSIEMNRWVLDGSYKLVPDNKDTIEDEIGMWFQEISDKDGNFKNPQWAQITFSGVSLLQGFTLFFSDHSYDGTAEDFSAELWEGGVLRYSKSVKGNTDGIVVMSGFNVRNPDTIKVTVTKWSLPYRRVRFIEIYPGFYEKWDGNALASMSIKQQGDVSCIKLPYGTCALSIDNADRRFDPRNKGGIFASIEERQAIDVSIGVRTSDGDDYKRVGLFYQFSGGWKTSNNGITINWDLVDIVGLLQSRIYIAPETLPKTLDEWTRSIVGQLGENFEDQYIVDSNYADIKLSPYNSEDLADKTCGDLLRFACMATGTWPRADASTGKLAIEPLWSEGNKITLDNIESYPTMKANEDIAAIIFKVGKSQIVVGGNSTAANTTVSISNPFIYTRDAAILAARNILSMYGGNRYDIIGRGDPSSEIGDVDTIWLDESSAATARRIQQEFKFNNGVMSGCGSELLQADGTLTLYQDREVILKSGTWTSPPGIRSFRLILIGQGEDGGHGRIGRNGENGAGGKVWSGIVYCNEQQKFSVSIGENATFGVHSSANGERYENGYTDITSGNVFGRTGVSNPMFGSGDGGKGGKAGANAITHEEKWVDVRGWPHYVTIVDSPAVPSTPGVKGAAGSVVIYYDKVN